MTDPQRPVLLFDGDCAFCTAAVSWARRIAPGTAMRPWQHADLSQLGVTADACRAEVQWVPAQGPARGGAAAVAALLRSGRQPWPLVGRGLTLWPLSALAAAGYRWVAANRHRLPGATPACSLPVS